MSTLSEKLKEFESLNVITPKDLYEIIKTTELSVEDVSSNVELFRESLNEFLVEDDAFNGESEEMGGEFNFTEVAKTPAEKQALIDKVLDLNRRFMSDKRLQKENEKSRELILRSQLEELLKSPEEKERYDFIGFMKDGVEIFGIVREEVNFSGQNYSSVIPFFQTDKDVQDGLKLLRNQESILIDNKEITKSLQQTDGMEVWKNLIKKEGVNPELEIKSKIKHIVSPKVEKAFSKNTFSFQKLFDDSIRDSQSILKGAGRNANFEDVLNEVFVSVRKSEGARKKMKSAVYNMFKPTIEDESKPLQERMGALINAINEETKAADLKFIDDFTHKFKNGELSDDDIVALINKYESNKDNSISSVISEFVETKKQELSLNKKSDSSETLNVNFKSITINDVVAFEDNGKYLKGKVIEYSEDKLKIQMLDKSIKECPADKATKLFKGQKFTIEQVEKAFLDSNILLKFNDLSNESKINMLKGDLSQMFEATYIKQDNNGFKISEDKEFKLMVKFDENKQLILKPVYKNSEFNLDELEIKGQKLSPEQKKDLLDNKIIVFEVHDKNGTLQYATDMKYDAELNDVFYKSNKGIDYAKSMKEGVKNEFTATTKIIDKGSSTGMKI
ncbi:hypothetical protein C1631_022915 [Chryseobacterium phosphatilyticum]|uniref:Uncharacterized protein n=1 Tax=Chryseobacterium phosphatilyticum TaxID=475075 RepID=A0A316WV05_9FLAO|nr:hypothetical protein [Chryseobacterium phosphatilyticum]PWN62420.1 hypothetical protein C1631_022915 [Chryseobacterium phosphatilyticum]